MTTRIKSYDQLPQRTLPVQAATDLAYKPSFRFHVAISLTAVRRTMAVRPKHVRQLPQLRHRSVQAILVLLALVIGTTPLLINTTDPAGAVSNSALSLSGYIWENEDGSGPDTVSQLAAGNGIITAPWGGRLNLRAQIKNTGDALSNTNLGLFYDKGDGLWSRVNNSSPKRNNNTQPAPPARLSASGVSGKMSTVVIDNNNIPWAVFRNGTTANQSLIFAKYVGTGGTGCYTAEWTCAVLESQAGHNTQSSILINPKTGKPSVSAKDNLGDLFYADYVGTGGTGCTSSEWTCTFIKTEANQVDRVGDYSSLAYDADGNPWISYNNMTDTSLEVARYVGSGGTGCNSGVTAWECTVVDNTDAVGEYTSIGFNSSNKAFITYYDAGAANLNLKVAEYLGSGGSCTSSKWDCYTVDSTNDVGQMTSLKIAPSGSPWVSYFDNTIDALKLTQYVGSSGTGCADSRWTCVIIDDDSSDDLGRESSLAFDVNGDAWISYRNNTGSAMLAKYIGGSGGNCYNTAWKCVEIDNINNSGRWTSLAIDKDNFAWISYTRINSDLTDQDDDIYITKLKDWPIGSDCKDNIFGSYWDCYSIDTSGGTGRTPSLAIDPSGVPWVSYWRSGSSDLVVAKYVGTGGTGCNVASWHCYAVHTSGGVGRSTSLAFTSSGQPWISYHASVNVNNDLAVARFVGTGGTGCANAAWDCDTVDTAATVDEETAIGLDSSGTAWVAYNDSATGSLKIAKYVGTGGTGCNDSSWTCTSVDNGNAEGAGVSIAFDLNGSPWVSYISKGAVPEEELLVARYVGTGGTGCLTSEWQCSSVYGEDLINETSIRFSPSGNAWIAFKDGGNTNSLIVAKYVGTGGTGCYGGNTAWQCTVIDNTNDAGQGVSLAFDPAGNPWISYQNETGIDSVQIARYVGGSGGNCATTASGWWCQKLKGNIAAAGNSINSSMAIDPDGSVWVAYFNSTGANIDLELAKLSRSGDIMLAGAGQYQNGASISESHADMTSATDTANRDDADCIGGGTWNNGRYFSSGLGTGISLPDGSSTAQCTEVVFSIDLSQAEPGATYRFAIATDDYWLQDSATWRGLSGGGQIPQLQVVNAPMLAAKDSSRQMPNCSGDSSWGCEAIDNLSGDARDPSLAFSPDGTPWISYYDNASSDLYLAQYVGTGGTGCASSAWTCTAIDTANTVGTFNSSLAFGPDGTPWISYYYATGADLRVAKYVGSGGTGCATTAWTCTDIKNTGTETGVYNSMAIDAKGRPFISYRSSGALEVAEYVGSGGTGCTSTAWKCTIVSSTSGSARSTAIAISPRGDPWIVHLVGDTGGNIVVARYVGAGGSGCTSTQWTCTTIANTDTTSASSQSIAFDADGDARVSYRTNTGTANLFMAEFVGSGGTGCSNAAWTCTTVDDDATNTYGFSSSLAFSSAGNATISYRVDTGGQDLKVARYVGSGGTGCSNAAWQCSAIDTTNDTGSSSSLAFDMSGNAWVAYIDNTNTQLMIAKTHRPFDSLNTNQLYKNPGRNAQHSAARYPLTLGGATASLNGQCNTGTADYFGLCALFHASGDYDTVTTQANESPYMTFTSVQSNNSELPTGQWSGSSSLAPNTAGAAGNIVLQVYRYGTTNAWETIATDSASASCTTRCDIEGQASGTASEYFESVSGKYRVHFRLYQEASTVSGITFKTDQFKSATNEQRTRHGGYMFDGIKRPLNWR